MAREHLGNGRDAAARRAFFYRGVAVVRVVIDLGELTIIDNGALFASFAVTMWLAGA